AVAAVRGAVGIERETGAGREGAAAVAGLEGRDRHVNALGGAGPGADQVILGAGLRVGTRLRAKCRVARWCARIAFLGLRDKAVTTARRHLGTVEVVRRRAAGRATVVVGDE